MHLRILTAALLVSIAIVGFAISARVNSSPLQAFSVRLDNDVNRAVKANRTAVIAPAQPMQTSPLVIRRGQKWIMISMGRRPVLPS